MDTTKAAAETIYEEFLNHAPKLVCDFEKAAMDKNEQLVILHAKLNRTLFHQIGATALANSFDAYTANPKMRNKAWVQIVSDAKIMIGKVIESLEQPKKAVQMQNNKNLTLDLSQLAQLKNTSPTFVNDMINLYENQNIEYLCELQQAIENKNLKKVRKIAHTMKSSFVIIGCNKLKNTAIEIEVITESAAPNLTALNNVFISFKADVNTSIELLKTESQYL